MRTGEVHAEANILRMQLGRTANARSKCEQLCLQVDQHLINIQEVIQIKAESICHQIQYRYHDSSCIIDLLRPFICTLYHSCRLVHGCQAEASII